MDVAKDAFDPLGDSRADIRCASESVTAFDPIPHTLPIVCCVMLHLTAPELADRSNNVLVELSIQ